MNYKSFFLSILYQKYRHSLLILEHYHYWNLPLKESYLKYNLIILPSKMMIISLNKIKQEIITIALLSSYIQQ